MRIPPHLPAPICDISSYRKLQRLKVLAVAVAFGLLAGLTGAAMMLGWIWPNWAEGDVWVTSRSVIVANRGKLEEMVRLDMKEKVATVYSGKNNWRQASYLNPKDVLGDAAIVSSDGWAVMYYPEYVGSYRNWQVVINDKVLSISNAVFDRVSGLLFVKLGTVSTSTAHATPYKVSSFDTSVSVGDGVFVYNASLWQAAEIVSNISEAAKWPHLDTAPVNMWAVGQEHSAGKLVINNDGKVVGITTGRDLILPIEYASRVLPQVLGGQKIAYPSLGVNGWFDSERPIVANGTAMRGFAISDVWGKSPLLRAGDILLEINGKAIVENTNLWYDITGATTLNLKVWRSGKIIDLTVQPTEWK